MAQFIKPNGVVVELVPAKGKHFSLEELQDLVGGIIQMTETKDGRIIVCNEEGKLKGFPINPKATLIYKYGEQDEIVGDVLVCNKKELR